MGYTWVRMKMTVRNRDRRGGHQSTALPSEQYEDVTSPVSRKLRKKMTRKEMRQEHQKIIRESVSTWERDAQDDRDLYWLENEWYDDEPMDYPDWWYGYDDVPDHLSPGYEPDDYYDDFDYGMDWYRSYESGVVREETPHDRIIKEEDCGKSLGDLLQEIIDRKEGRHDDHIGAYIHE